MDLKWSVRNKKKEFVESNELASPQVGEKMSVVQNPKVPVEQVINQEIKAMFEEEIQNAAKELAKEQRICIRAAVEENKKIIREVLEQEKLSIHAKLEEMRKSIVRLGMR